MFFLFFTQMNKKEDPNHSLTVKVNNLRNSTGVVQFTLYNSPDGFPDEHYKKYFLQYTAKIVHGKSEFTFQNLPSGKYAVNILHDEDGNGRIKKGLLLLKEGIGFSNFSEIGIGNKPNFEKARFNLTSEKTIDIRVIYF